MRARSAEGNARGADEGACAIVTGLPALHGRLITMKLHCSARHTCGCSYYFRSGCVDEQQHRRDKWRQAGGQFCSALGADGARAGRIQHKADGIDPGGDGGVYILLAREAADFDAGAVQGRWGG